jgi:translation initiation factor IF-1
MIAPKEHVFEGTVLETLPNLEYSVELDDRRVVRCYSAGKLKIHRIFICIGDRVRCVVPPQSSVGRIVFRIQNKT